MGFNISWIGFQGLSKEEALARTGLIDTGLIDEAHKAPLLGAEVPGGWFILLSNDIDYVSEDRLPLLSAGCRIVACQVHEGIMISRSFGYDHGEHIWTLTHIGDEGVYDLDVSGSPPAIYESVRQRLMQEQDEAGGEAADVDLIFDIPVETAALLCKYRYNGSDLEWGEPKFTRLEVAEAIQSAPPVQ